MGYVETMRELNRIEKELKINSEIGEYIIYATDSMISEFDEKNKPRKLIRCKDCRYYINDGVTGVCEKNQNIYPGSNDFCSNAMEV